MKQKLILLSGLLMACGTMMGQTLAKQAVTVDQQAVGKDVTSITFSGDNVKLKFADNTETEADMSTVSIDLSYPYARTAIPEGGYRSFSSDHALDFSQTSVVAYIAANIYGSTVLMSEVSKVPAATGLVIQGNEGVVKIPYLEDASDDIATNLLIANLTQGSINEPAYYVLEVVDGQPVFTATSGGELAANTSYLVATGTSAQSLELNFNEPTGISDAPQSQIANSSAYSKCFDLQGRRVADVPLKKGVYIVGGKKLIKK